MLSGDGPILVVAPHPDDEVLGTGGTIARLAREDRDVYVAIVTYADDVSLFDRDLVEEGRREALRAHEALGVRKTIFLEGLSAAKLDTVPHSKLNAVLGELFADVDPELLFVPFPGDLHKDHRLVFESTLVATRPNKVQNLRSVFAYETLSETNWNAAPLVTPGFLPNTYVDIAHHLEAKLEAMSLYRTQLREFPNERSLQALRALALMRGATVGLSAAEAFVLVRSTIR